MSNISISETGISTNWYVITGAPCSGKTAVIEQLASRGYRTVPEVARAYIEAQLTQGKTLSAIKNDLLAFERHILLEKVCVESGLPEDEVIFLDRAVPDSIAYYNLEGLDPDEPAKHSDRLRYKKVFLFEALKFEKDTVRSENQILSTRIESLLNQAYVGLGYSVLRVPVMSIDQRVEFVLSHCHTLPISNKY